MTRIAIIGAGNSGLAMAAHLSVSGNEVCLWNRSEEHIKELVRTGCISCHGMIEQEVSISKVSTDLGDVISDAGMVFITTPASAHRDLADQLQPYVSEDMCIILNPGRTFGALEFEAQLRKSGCISPPSVAESQTIIYTCRKTSSSGVNLIAFKQGVLLAATRALDTARVFQKLPSCLRSSFRPAKSMIQTSLGNVGMILHCAPMLLNAGRVEDPKTSFRFYADGITPTVARFLETLDRERLEVARLLGEEIESVTSWMQRSYGIGEKSLYGCIRNNPAYRAIAAPATLFHRYIFEDLPCGLVPLEATGRCLGLPMKYTGLVIDLASTLLSTDFRSEGRNLGRLGLSGLSGTGMAGILKG